MTDPSPLTEPSAQEFGGWNLAELFEALADHLGDEPAIIETDRTISWRRMDQRADGVARHLLTAGLRHQARVAVCAHNGAAYIESYLACFKAGLVPFNVNYRYHAPEMAYLLTNADAEAVVADAAFADTVIEAVALAGGVATTVWVGGGDDQIHGPRYEEVVGARGSGRTVAPWGRTPGDQLFQYTGGTTGRPKAAIWRQCDLVDLLAGTTTPPGEPVVRSEADMVSRIEAPPRRSLSAAPLMHGTGMLSQLANMMTGGAMVVAAGDGFDAATTLATVERERVEVLVIVGDTFSLPLLAELERPGATRDLSSLKMITSAGAMWSRPVKARLLERLPSVALFDAFGSTECSGLGTSVAASASDLDGTARFRAGEHVRVLGDDGRWIEPGSGRAGRVATTGAIPIGYHKDPERSLATFPEIDGVRYAVPGDLVTLEADGSLTFLGRGSSCINTGGEKVHPEEVEERLKEHPAVVDAACLGVPDPRLGQMVVGLVVLREPGGVDEATLIAHVRSALAGYKTPKRVLEVASLERSPSAKLDLRHLTAVAHERLGLDPPPAAGPPAS